MHILPININHLRISPLQLIKKNVDQFAKYLHLINSRYCLADSNVNDPNFDNLKEEKVPDVVLVSKFYGERIVRKRYREWKLRHLHDDVKSTNTSVCLINNLESFDFNLSSVFAGTTWISWTTWKTTRSTGRTSTFTEEKPLCHLCRRRTTKTTIGRESHCRRCSRILFWTMPKWRTLREMAVIWIKFRRVIFRLLSLFCTLLCRGTRNWCFNKVQYHLLSNDSWLSLLSSQSPINVICAVACLA